jgi:hypothetical protein
VPLLGAHVSHVHNDRRILSPELISITSRPRYQYTSAQVDDIQDENFQFRSCAVIVLRGPFAKAATNESPVMISSQKV